MKVPPPPSYDETTATAPPPPQDNSNNINSVYPPIPEFNDQQQFPQPLMGSPPQNDDAPYSQPHPNVDQFLGPFPQHAYCPTCKQHTLTEVKYVSGLFTWILVFVFIIFGLLIKKIFF
ncbi:LITAF domain-containing protein [Meloidogyne graminicola]|uniref:LITAF domain-containing protein n=1 Tax=Meloidogyne graminicola TaxID=189291 RepID=A0A8S9ZN92_9BILA|nr:LITAF domain-containing protein [Meloidogyne graminicola]